MGKIAIVTGGTSGIGLETARCLQQDGWKVYTLSRRTTGAEDRTHIPADITLEDTLEQAIQQVVDQERHIDLLVNCAGSGISGAIEFTSVEAAQKQFNTVFFGMVRMNRLVLPIMRKQGYGRIIQVSSVAAVCPIPFQAYYAAAKAAVNSYSMALANEIHPFGIGVCTVLPGDIKTGFTAMREKQTEGDAIYGGRISRSVQRMEHDEQNGMEASLAGAFIARLARRKRLPLKTSIGFVYKCFSGLAKLLPCRLCNWILGKLYAA